MEFYKELGLLKDTAHDIKELHELIYNVILIFAPLHILGVFMAENRDEKGILSDMVNGGEEE
ncbi:Ni,Fe-hydrogenase I cytochrome b subunit [hydrothermal vent metagenome]|uniref:Ni,Fe-hydrogenase I cytochrome b subunit n=1 Tax=hydrothermal vent metagenome TaxID=652676 RepID=A0A1W1EBX5_9ZZZZ